ncbi:MAG: hypothetical protein JSV88_21770, partial [Candidatus Aminicenantes bacterium]
MKEFIFVISGLYGEVPGILILRISRLRLRLRLEETENSRNFTYYSGKTGNFKQFFFSSTLTST